LTSKIISKDWKNESQSNNTLPQSMESEHLAYINIFLLVLYNYISIVICIILKMIYDTNK